MLVRYSITFKADSVRLKEPQAKVLHCRGKARTVRTVVVAQGSRNQILIFKPVPMVKILQVVFSPPKSEAIDFDSFAMSRDDLRYRTVELRKRA
jgi:hypothetical protein